MLLRYTCIYIYIYIYVETWLKWQGGCPSVENSMHVHSRFRQDRRRKLKANVYLFFKIRPRKWNLGGKWPPDPHGSYINSSLI